MMIEFKWSTFENLTVDQLYDVLQLRSEIFVIDQKCLFLDIDGKDKSIVHLLGTQQNKLVAYLRLFPPTSNQPYVYFGRVVVSPDIAGKGYGKKLMTELMQYCNAHYQHEAIRCSAQAHLRKFYEGFGLKPYTEPYVEDGILHIDMKTK
jgi:ElaA protein